MTVVPLRPPRRRFHLPVLPLLSGGFLLAAIILLGVEAFHFFSERKSSTIVVAGVPIGGLRPADARRAWEHIYAQPVELDYGSSPILLDPLDLDFHLNSDVMLQELQHSGSSTASVFSDFWNYLWRRQGPGLSIALEADYQEARLRDVLQDIARRYDGQANQPSFNLETLTFNAGNENQVLDVEASMREVDAALRRPSNRRVQLVMKSQAADQRSLDSLKQAIVNFLKAKGFSTDGPETFVSFLVIDLKSGQEISLNPDIAYSAESTIKVPILINMFRTLTAPPSDDIKFLMAASILCSSNDASNNLIRFSGTGGATLRDQFISGMQAIIGTVQQLGAKNTFITAPIDVNDPALHFSIASPKTNPDKRFDAKPDPFSQTTAADMAILLSEMYDCAEYDSGFIAAFPDKFTPTKCRQMIELLSGNIIGHLIELGVPAGTRVAHKNGWGAYSTGYNSSDAAIVYTPGGNYVLVIYMWEKLKEGAQVGSIVPWQMIESISRLVYNYYNPQHPTLQNRTPENPLTALGCVMPNNQHPERIDLDNIRNGRFEADGRVVADACYDWPACTPIPASKLSAPANAVDLSGTTPEVTATPESAGEASTLEPPPPK